MISNYISYAHILDHTSTTVELREVLILRVPPDMMDLALFY